MKYNFDEVIDRRNTDSLKWNVGENELPLWVADMDFKAPPCVINALEKRVKHGIFGYTDVPEAWKVSIQNWWERRHQYTINADWLIFATGVVPAISTAVKRLTNAGDQVLIQTPGYNIFFNSIVNHGRHIIENELTYENGVYEIDFKDLEIKLSHPLTTLMILCNPHNPIGKIWDKETLIRIGDLCAKHHVTVISDEIHCDLTTPGHFYVPFGSASKTCEDISVTCLSASKAFNLAGLQSAIVYAPNPSLRAKMTRGLNSDEVAEPNAFAAVATVAAFNEGEEWLEALRIYIEDNKQRVREFMGQSGLNVYVVPSKATYLLWLDFAKVTGNVPALQQFIRNEEGLYLSVGEQFGKSGSSFLRMNVACPLSVLEEALKRLERAVKKFMNDSI